MNKFAIVLLVSVFSVPAFAQQPDPAFMQKAITALQAQRNQALDSAAVAEAKASGVSDELNNAKNRIKELEDKYEPKKAEDKKK